MRPAKTALLLALAALPAGAVEVELLSRVAPGRESATASGASFAAAISADGRYVAWQLETVALITRSADDPEATVNSNVGGSLRGQLSADGRFVAFLSNASDVVPEIRRALVSKVYLWERATGATERVSPPEDSGADLPVISSTDLVPGDFNRSGGPLPDAFGASIP